MRCLTLADAVSERGGQCHFICRAHPGHLINAIHQRGYTVAELPVETISLGSTVDGPAHASWLGASWEQDATQTLANLSKPADWLVVDHYGLDIRWENRVKPSVGRLMVIDDLADRPHQAGLLLDQNLGRVAADYAELLPAETELRLGPVYALLRPEFAAQRSLSLSHRSGSVRKLLISMGGIDKDNATGAVLRQLASCSLPADCEICVVMGQHAPWREAVEQQLAELPWSGEVRVEVNDMAGLIAASDLAIGAAGTSAWERCCLGLPTLTAILASNQRDVAKALAKSGCVELIGEEAADFSDLPQKLDSMLNSARLRSMQEICSSLTDGLGASRLVSEMEHA